MDRESFVSRHRRIRKYLVYFGPSFFTPATITYAMISFFKFRLLFIVTSLCVSITFSSAQEGLVKEPLAAGSPNANGPLFELLSPKTTGIEHFNPIDENHPLVRVYHSSSACGGIAIGDINLDGKLDVFAASGARGNSLLLGKPDGNGLEFDNVAVEMGVAGEELDWGIGAAMVDVDNDGDLDIYICNYDRENQLFMNTLITDGKRGKLGFENKAKEWGVDLIDGCVMPAFADYDRDGDLDLYVLTHQLYRENGRPEEPIKIIERNGVFMVDEKWQRYFKLNEDRGEGNRFEYSEVGRPDYFFRNDGDKFTDVAEEAGISRGRHWGNSATWWDFNHDGWPDLYVGNDFKSPDYMYRNNGDGTFAEVSKEQLRHSTWFSMGAVQTDLNNDGWTDFVVADMLPSSHYMQKASMGSMGARQHDLEYVDGARQLMRNAVHINTGADQFMEGAWLTGLATTEWTWAIRSQDFDNDGLMDVFFTNGIPRQFNHSDLPNLEHADLVGRSHWSHYKDTPMRREQNQIYHNEGDLNFKEVGRKWGVDHIGISYGASTADFDGDGRLELLVANLEDPLSFYHNRGAGGNRAVFDLVGTRSNKFGIGATVTVKAGSESYVRQLYPSGGYLDGDDTIVHFGLGGATAMDSVKIEWPSGHEQKFENLASNHRYIITEPSGVGVRSTPVKSRAPKNPMFTESKALSGFKHSELEFDDFVRQILLPFKMSQLGPGQAWGDVDGDGDPDFYLGGAGGQPGQLFLNDTVSGSTDVEMKPQPVVAFSRDAQFEDMGVLFFDCDGDGDLDLYVASGGTETVPNGPALRDRLYLNDGKGDFERAPETMTPDFRESSSVVTAADYDHDGDLDLFVGSRTIPGQYPVTPKSILLQNEGWRFTAAAETAAPELAEIGMVTSAIWSDVDSDGWSDLLVTLDWGTVKLFRNREGKLELASDEETGFVGKTGWYNGISGGDIDGDGDMDFVVTNLGTNTQYQASTEMPRMIFYSDIEGNGKYNIIEAMFETTQSGEKIPFPFRGKSCSTEAIPGLANKFTTYDQFAKATLPEVYPVQKLEKSLHYTATNFKNLVMINDGEGNFSTLPLPHITEVSMAFGVVLSDVDLDGKVDCYLVQNFYTPQPETGEFDCGLSMLLRGTGDSANPFTPVWPKESGLFVPGDAKSVTAVDVNLDGKNDYVIGQNDDEPKIFLNETKNKDTHPLRIRLKGKAGNPRGIGARVSVAGPGIPTQTAEIYAGGGYLSQGNTDLIFAMPNSMNEKEIVVKIRWPEGGDSQIEAKGKSRFLSLSRE